MHFFKGHQKRYRRYFLHGKNSRFSLEVSYRHKVSSGFRLHFGDRGSETPIVIMVSFYWIAFFIGMSWPGLSRFCEWLGRGHHRNLSLTVHGGKIWWELWYDDQDGNDSYHKCDSWRRPKLHPWRWGRRKHRGWMCLRQGNFDLNPLDALWDSRYYHYVDFFVLNNQRPLYINQFPDDHYDLELKLRKVLRYREHGPKWVRHKSDEGFMVEWRTSDGEGIPVLNDEWKGDNVISSSVAVAQIDPDDHWQNEALDKIKAKILKYRERYNYRPPRHLLP